jgi:hypothetical protein
MKTFAIVTGAAQAALLVGPAAADVGAHAHPHLAQPLLALSPAQGLVATLVVWAAVVVAVEAIGARRRRAAI